MPQCGGEKPHGDASLAAQGALFTLILIKYFNRCFGAFRRQVGQDAAKRPDAARPPRILGLTASFASGALKRPWTASGSSNRSGSGKKDAEKSKLDLQKLLLGARAMSRSFLHALFSLKRLDCVLFRHVWLRLHLSRGAQRRRGHERARVPPRCVGDELLGLRNPVKLTA